MSIQKKSLIGNLTAAKKAITAALNVASVSEAKVRPSRVAPLRNAPLRNAPYKAH